MKKINISKIMVLILLFYLFTFFTVSLWAKEISFEIGALLEQFNWKEVTDNGTLIKEESGLRKGINIAWWNKEALNYSFMDFAIYSGTVDYKFPPLENVFAEVNYLGDVHYLGIKGETGIGFPTEIILGYIPVKTIPYLCVGLDYWSKTKNLTLSMSTDLGKEEVDIDYEELWMVLFWKIGIRSEIELIFGQLVVNLWAGSDILSKNRKDISKFLDYFENYLKNYLINYDINLERIRVTPEIIELKPDGSFFYGIDGTLSYNKFFIRGYFKHYKWNKSSEEKVYVEYEYVYEGAYGYIRQEDYFSISMYQPESEENDFGIVIGLTF